MIAGKISLIIINTCTNTSIHYKIFLKVLPAAVTTTMLLVTASLIATLTASVFGPINDMEITDRLPVCLAC